MANALIPPMDPRVMAAQGMQNPFMPPPPPPSTSPSMGFQVWASDPQNAHKVVPAMTEPTAPLQPNAGQPQQMASASPPPVAPMASTTPPPSQLDTDTAELQRLQQSGAAVNHVQNPVLRTLGKIGDIAAPFLLGRGAMAIPGTTAHNIWLQDRQQGRVEDDRAAQDQTMQMQTGAANLAHLNAETAAIPINAGQKRQQYMASLAAKGLREDENGNIVDNEDSQPFQHQQIANQLAQASIDLKRAQADYERSKNDPKSPAFKQAAQRLQIAQQTQDRLTGMMGAMQERADATMMTAKARTLGVDMSGNPLPGSMLTEEGDVVGGMNATNVRPTGTQRAKGNMAESADQQINDMKGIVAARPDIFGPAAGRTTDFTVWLGSQDPDAQRFRAARTIAGDHLAGTFGGRSEAALNALDSAIGHFRDNPAAVTAGLNQLQEANQLFLKAGKVRTVGSKSNPMAPPKQAAPAGGMIRAFDEKGVLHEAPAGTKLPKGWRAQ